MAASPTRIGWCFGGGSLLGMVVLVGLGYGTYLFLHPYDEVVIEVRDLPAGTTFVCLIADVPSGPILMPWSLQKVFPFTMHPSGCTVSTRMTSETGPHRASVQWITGKRAGVLFKGKSGQWVIAWFDAANSHIQERSLLFGRGSWQMSLRDATSEQDLDEQALRSLGLDYRMSKEK